MDDVTPPRNASEKWPRRSLRSRTQASSAGAEDANERLRAVLASVSDCYFTLDRAYRITDLNEAAKDWVGPIRTGSWAHAFGTCAILRPSAAAPSRKACKHAKASGAR